MVMHALSSSRNNKMNQNKKQATSFAAVKEKENIKENPV